MYKSTGKVIDDMSNLLSELKKSVQEGRDCKNRVDVQMQTDDFIGENLEKWQQRIDTIESERDSLKQKLIETELLLNSTQEKLIAAEIDKKNNAFDIEEEVVKRVKDQLENKETEFRIAIEQKSKECNELKELYIQLRTSKEQRNKLEVEKEARRNITAQLTTLTEQIDNYKSQIAIKDELLTKYKMDNDLTVLELNKLKNNLSLNANYNEIIAKKDAECAILKEEIQSSSKRYADELERLKGELDTAKDRLLLLEKNLRAEFSEELNKYIIETSNLQSALLDKELKLKIASEKLKSLNLNRVDKGLMTDSVECFTSEQIAELMKENQIKIKQLSEKHSNELKLCMEDCSRKVEALGQMHKEALESVSKKEEDIRKAEEKHQKLISLFQKQFMEQEQTLKSKYLADLAKAEEQVKDVTVKYFADEIKKLEARHRIELETIAKHVSTSPIEKMQRLITAKDLEIEKLKSDRYTDAEERITELQNQIETDRDNTAELMARWAKEVQALRVDLSEKQRKLEEMKEKMVKVKTAAHYFRQELKTHKNNTASLLKRNQCLLLEQLQDKIDKAFEADSNNEFKHLEEKYSAKEEELRRKLKR